MPTYCYTCTDCGTELEDCCAMEARRPTLTCPHCGAQAPRDFMREHTHMRTFPANWPMESDALGVHPNQVEDARRESERLGVPTDFTRDGRAILVSPAHRKRYARALGFHDRNGGYSDP